MSKWIDIAALCEKATGPDREIDVGIMEALGFRWIGRTNAGPGWIRGSDIVKARSSYVSASIDAITALIDRELPGSMRSIRKHPEGEAVAQVWNSQVVGETPRQRCCASEALALCAALARAMNEKEANT